MMAASKNIPKPLLAAVTRFLTEYEASFDEHLALANKAFEAREVAYLYLCDFTLENKGLTADEATELLQRWSAAEVAQYEVDIADVKREAAIQRLNREVTLP